MITTFEQANETPLGVGLGELFHPETEGEVIFHVEIEASDRILVVGIKASADEDELGLEAVGEGFDFGLDGLDDFAGGGFGVEGEIDGEAKSWTGAGFLFGTGAWIEGEAVGGEETDLGVCPEGILGSVTVMDIPIDDEDAFETCEEGFFGGDGHIVEEAEAHGAGGEGVVSGWSDGGEGESIFAGEDTADGIAGCTGGQ